MDKHVFIGPIIVLGISAAILLVLPWFFKFMDWYYPWVNGL